MNNLFKPRTIFAFMFYATACYLILKQVEIPQFLNTICSTLMGYYYGSKKQKEVDGGSKTMDHR